MVEPQLRFRDDAPVDSPAIGLADFTAGSNVAAVRIEAGEDARLLLPHLASLRLVEIVFPAFTDGRGMSAARVLREAGYAGELRAVGAVLVDQLAAMRRCGFDAFAPAKPLDAKDAEAALARWGIVYQSAADGVRPIWALRHAAAG